MVKGRVTLRSVYTYSTCSWHSIRVALSEQRQSRHKNDPATKVIWRAARAAEFGHSLAKTRVLRDKTPRGVWLRNPSWTVPRQSVHRPRRFQLPLRLPHVLQGPINNIHDVRLAVPSPGARNDFRGIHRGAVPMLGLHLQHPDRTGCSIQQPNG